MAKRTRNFKKVKDNNYPKKIVELISEKVKARKKWQRTRNPQDETRLNRLAFSTEK